ncbi:hypothetical protein ACR2WA_25355, partial [Klebsiella pneumoniae]
PCPLRLLLLVLVVLLTAGAVRGQAVGEFQDSEEGLVAVRAPGSKTCYIVDVGYTDRDKEEEEENAGKLAISLDESRTDQPKLSPEFEEFCDGRDPRWATAEPAEGAAGADVIVYTGGPEEQEKPGGGQTKFWSRRRSSWIRRRTVWYRRRTIFYRRRRRRSWLG